MVLKKSKKIKKKSTKRLLTLSKTPNDTLLEDATKEESEGECAVIPEDDDELELASLDEEDVEENSADKPVDNKEQKSGVLYFSSIPPRFTPQRLQEYFEKYAPGFIGRVFLEKNKHTKSIDNRFREGWLEIKKKKLAKRIAEAVDSKPVGGKKRDPASGVMWNIKYLSGFKWIHLIEQLEYEKSSHTRRMNAEINQARRIASHFEEQIEKGENLRRLEKKTLKEGGNWEAYQRQIEQKQAIKKGKKKTPKEDDLMEMIFAE